MDFLQTSFKRSSISPPDPQALSALGTELFRLGRYPEAGKYLNSSLIQDSQQHEISKLLNQILKNLGKSFQLQSKVGSFLCCDPKGNYIATGGSGKDPIIIWDFWNRVPLKTFPNPGGFVRAMCFSPCSRYVVVGGNDQEVRLGDIHDDEGFTILGAHDDFVISVGFHQDRLFSAGQDGKILAFQKTEKGFCSPDTVLQNPLFYSMAVNSDAIYLAGYGVSYYSFQKLTEPQVLKNSRQALFFSLDLGKDLIITGEGDASNATHLRYIWVFDKDRIWRFPGHHAMIKSVQIHQKYPYVLSSGFDGKTKIFATYSGEEIATYPALITGMSCFHPYADYFIHFGAEGDLEVLPLPK